MRGYADIAAGWFGQTAALHTLTWEKFRESTTREYAESSWGHLHRSHYLTIEKSVARLGYAPSYEPDAAILESVRWLIHHDRLKVRRPLIGCA